MAKWELRVSVDLHDMDTGYNRLNVSETVQVNADSFLEVAKILGRFHDLANELNKLHG